jgi:ribosomal protein S6
MLNQDQASDTWGRIKDFISNRDGDITHEEKWGTRRLAYPIRKGSYQFLEGSYHLTRFSAEKPFNQELQTFLRLDEQVLRSLVVVAQAPGSEPEPVVAEAPPAQAQDEATASGEVVAEVEAEDGDTEAPVAEEPTAEVETTEEAEPVVVEEPVAEVEEAEEEAEAVVVEEPAAEIETVEEEAEAPAVEELVAEAETIEEEAPAAAEPVAEASDQDQLDQEKDNGDTDQNRP